MLRALMRPSAALVAAAALSLPLAAVVGTAAPARAEVVPEPPPVGSCHDLTLDEAAAESDPDPAVECTEHHTTITVGAIQFETAPNWNDTDSYGSMVQKRCVSKMGDFFDDRYKALSLSTWTVYWFIPTSAERDAGATWVRCDAAVYSPGQVPPLPTSDTPLLQDPPASWARWCTQSKDKNFATTTCNRSHAYRATDAIKYSGSYPGADAGNKWALRKCRARFGDRPFLYYFPGKVSFNIGYRFAVCFKKTTS